MGHTFDGSAPAGTSITPRLPQIAAASAATGNALTTRATRKIMLAMVTFMLEDRQMIVSLWILSSQEVEDPVDGKSLIYLLTDLTQQIVVAKRLCS